MSPGTSEAAAQAGEASAPAAARTGRRRERFMARDGPRGPARAQRETFLASPRGLCLRQKALLVNSSVGLGFGNTVSEPGLAIVNSVRKALPCESRPW